MPTGGHGHVICMGNLGRVLFCENTPEGHTEAHKSSFFLYKQVGEMVIMNYLEWPMFSYYVIYYEKFRKVMKQTEKEALMFNQATKEYIDFFLYF